MKEIPMLDMRREYEYMKDAIDVAIEKCLKHQRWIMGPELGELEKRIADYLNIEHFIGVSSGTDALILSLRALAIKNKGMEYFESSDKIITTPFTFIATAESILRAGATPVFVDIDPVSFNIDPGKIKEYILETSGNVTGILPVHLYGASCNMSEVGIVADNNDLFVVEDVAQGFGGKWRNEMLGTLGTAGAFSFFPSKNLGGFGDGGGISTNDDEIAEIVRMLLKHGGRDKYNAEYIGYNARLDTIQSAILLARLEYVNEFIERRRRIGELYSQGLSNIENIVCPKEEAQQHNAYNQYTIRVLNGGRDNLKEHLKQRGIDTMVYYPIPLHKMSVFLKRSVTVGSLPESEKAPLEVLSLPMEPLFTDEEILHVIESIKEAI